MPRHRFLFPVLLVALAACDDDPVAPRESIGVSGSIVLQDGFEIPPGARIVVGWFKGDDQPEEVLEIFGGAPLPQSATGFSLTMPSPPPVSATAGGQFGIGFLLVTTNPALGDGDFLGLTDFDALSGAAGRFVVIWSDLIDVSLVPEWAAAFPRGYSVGRGVVRGPDQLDVFEPVSDDAAIIEIGDIDAIEFVDFT